MQDNLRAKGVDSIAIANSKWINGDVWVESFCGEALDREYAEKRMRNEPIVEITQVKGT